MLVYYRLTNHQKTTLIQKKPKFILTSGHRQYFSDRSRNRTDNVLLQLKKQKVWGKHGFRDFATGTRFQATVRNGTRSAGWPLFHWLSPQFGPSQSTQSRRHFKNVCRSWKITMVMPRKTSSPPDRLPDKFIWLNLFFRLKHQSFFSLEDRRQSDNNHNRKHKLVSPVNKSKTQKSFTLFDLQNEGCFSVF